MSLKMFKKMEVLKSAWGEDYNYTASLLHSL